MQERDDKALETQERGRLEISGEGQVGVLLLHGFTSASDAVSGLIPTLEEMGISYEMPILRGHNATPEALIGVRSQDWYDDALAALQKLAQRAPRLVVVGLSMGGLVALQLCMRREAHQLPICACVTWAAALGFCNPLAFMVKPLSHIFRWWKGQESFRDATCRKNNHNYPKFPTQAFVELYDYAKATRAQLSQVDVPLCIIHSRRDQVVPYATSLELYRTVSSPYVVHHTLKKSGHELGQDCQCELVFALTGEFIAKGMKP